jgi:hypothetical protein
MHGTTVKKKYLKLLAMQYWKIWGDLGQALSWLIVL